MRKRCTITGAAVGFLWGLLVIALSDTATTSVVANLVIRAVAVCVFASIGGLAGLLVGWAVRRFFTKR